MAAPFSVGDVVELKSDSPKMTVQECDDSEAFCVWFVKDEPRQGSFAVGMLKKYEPPNWNIG